MDITKGNIQNNEITAQPGNNVSNETIDNQINNDRFVCDLRNRLQSIHLIGKQKMCPKAEECPKMFEVALQAESFCVHNGLLLARRHSTISVYSYDSNITLKLIKSFSKSSLVFLERYLSKDALGLMYKTVLDLVNKNVKIEEIERYLSEVMDSLHFDEIKTVEYGSRLISIMYRNGEIKFFNLGLELVDVEQEEEKESIKEDRKIRVKTTEDYVLVQFEGINILKRSIGRVKAVDITEDKVFLLQDTKLTVISLNQ